jgi:hypothetical protein
MGRQGWRASESHGFVVFRNVQLTQGSQDQNDVYIRVDKKNNDRNSAVIAALVVSPGQDPATAPARDPLTIGKGKAFLENLAPAITAGDLEARIKDQENTTKKAQGQLSDLRQDQVDLEKKIKNTKADLEKNKTDQLKETQAMQLAVNGNDKDKVKKSQKRMSRLVNDQKSLENKLQKYQAALEQNKRDQVTQEAAAQQQQSALDSLRSQRKH